MATKIYESVYGGSIQLEPDEVINGAIVEGKIVGGSVKKGRVIELPAKQYVTDDEEVQKLIESLKGFGTDIWEVDGVIAKENSKLRKLKIVSGPRSAVAKQ
jgi:hypothetical protein